MQADTVPRGLAFVLVIYLIGAGAAFGRDLIYHSPSRETTNVAPRLSPADRRSARTTRVGLRAVIARPNPARTQHSPARQIFECVGTGGLHTVLLGAVTQAPCCGSHTVQPVMSHSSARQVPPQTFAAGQHPSPSFVYPALQANPQLVPSQLATPFAGTGHGRALTTPHTSPDRYC